MICIITRETFFTPNHITKWDAEFSSISELRHFGRKESKKFGGCDITITDPNGKVWRYNRLNKK
jgi:hypothetical protein